jgi:hypothetical protein
VGTSFMDRDVINRRRKNMATLLSQKRWDRGRLRDSRWASLNSFSNCSVIRSEENSSLPMHGGVRSKPRWFMVCGVPERLFRSVEREQRDRE